MRLGQFFFSSARRTRRRTAHAPAATSYSRQPECLESRRLLTTQVVTPDPATISVAPASQVSFDVQYTARDANGDAAPAGMILRMHYDSMEVTPDIDAIRASAFSVSEFVTEVSDNEERAFNHTDLPNTDRYVSLVWRAASGTPAFPGTGSTLPMTLLTASFSTSESFDGLTIPFTSNLTLTVGNEIVSFESTPMELTLQGNSNPVINSPAAATVPDDQTSAIDVDATDADGDTLTYSISGGADAALLDINGATGLITFRTAPDFDVPNDANGDNVYEVTTRVIDGRGGSATQEISITLAETAGLTISLNADSISESETTTATVTRTGDTSSAVVINLSSSDSSEATVPATVAIEAGQTTSVPFTVSGVADNVVDGTQTATITATSDGLSNGDVTIEVTDSDTATSKSQHLSSDQTTKFVAPGSFIEVPVFYRTLDDGNPASLLTNLISFNFHFDSSVLTFIESTDVFSEGIQAVPSEARQETTVDGDDNDANTDSVLVGAWTDSDIASQPGWPNSPDEDGLLMFVARFQVSENFDETSVNFSANATGNVFGQAEEFEFSSQSLTIEAAETGRPGNVDGDDDFDANDSFLIHLVMLSGTNAQIDQSKGNSPFGAATIRDTIGQLASAADVDGDGDFDANDSFLIHLVKLSGSNAQIDQSKGPSPLTGAQIRANVEALGAAQQQSIHSLVSSAAIQTERLVSQPDSGRNDSQLTLKPDGKNDDYVTTFSQFRSWIDALGM